MCDVCVVTGGGGEGVGGGKEEERWGKRGTNCFCYCYCRPDQPRASGGQAAGVQVHSGTAAARGDRYQGGEQLSLLAMLN